MNRSGPDMESAPSRRICIVDDDAAVREALTRLMRSARFDVTTFESAEEFLGSQHISETDCLILDAYLPGMSGFELQQHLQSQRQAVPIVFITAHADEASRKRALRTGAVELLGKPVRRDALFKAIQAAFDAAGN